MSYEILTSFSFNNDFTEVNGKYYSSNVYPRTPSPFSQKIDEAESSFDFVKGFVNGFIDGTLQFSNKKHSINLHIHLGLNSFGKENIRDLWVSKFDYDSFDYDTKHLNAEDEADYNLKTAQREVIISHITTAIMGGLYNKEIKRLKKEQYVITNYASFISKLTKRGFHRVYHINTAKIINGIDKLFLPNYIFTQYNMKVVSLAEVKNEFSKYYEFMFAKRYEELKEAFNKNHPDLSKEDFISQSTTEALRHMSIA